MNNKTSKKVINPYVKDLFYFAKHPQPLSIFASRELFAWHYHVSGAIGFFLNALLIYLILFRTPQSLKPYARMLLLCCCADTLYLLMHEIAQARMKMNDGCLLFVLDGPATQLPYIGQVVCLSLLLGSMGSCLTVLPAQFYCRYSLMVKNVALSLKKTFLLGSISFLVAMSCVLLDIPNYSRSALARPEFDYGTLWFPENPVPQVLISDVRSYLAMVYLAYAMTIPSVGYLITIYFYWQTVKKMDTQSQGVNVSDKVKRLQQQFNRVLIIQAVIPLFTTVIPCLIACGSTLLFIDTGTLGSFMFLALGWLPVLNTFATLIFLPPYRNVIIRFLTTGRFALENKINISSVATINGNPTLPNTSGNQSREQRYAINS